jgi:hypothetical protein
MISTELSNPSARVSRRRIAIRREGPVALPLRPSRLATPGIREPRTSVSTNPVEII